MQVDKFLITYREFKQKYKIGKKLGSGGGGTVYLCTRNKDNATVALKYVVVNSMKLIENAYFEYVAVKKLNETIPSIVKYNAFFFSKRLDHSWNVYLDMEYLPGSDLKNVVKCMVETSYKLSDLELFLFLKKIVGIIAALHEQGIYYGDLKLENIVLSPPTGFKLIDFGHIGTRKYKLIERHGTPVYHPPDFLDLRSGEKISFEQSCAYDVWALALVILELISGKPIEQTLPSVKYLKNDVLSSLMETELFGLIKKMMKPDWKKRPTAKQILVELEEMEKLDPDYVSEKSEIDFWN